jgi:hypothetical protein
MKSHQLIPQAGQIKMQMCSSFSRKEIAARNKFACAAILAHRFWWPFGTVRKNLYRGECRKEFISFPFLNRFMFISIYFIKEREREQKKSCLSKISFLSMVFLLHGRETEREIIKAFNTG